jgi:undecaprenyl-diphosphatase
LSDTGERTDRPAPTRRILHPRNPKHLWHLLLATFVLVLSALPLRGNTVGTAEREVFEFFNQWPEAFYGVIWTIMQLGNILAVPATAAIAAAFRRFRLSLDLLVAGMTAWLLAQVVKSAVDRGRPGDLLDEVFLRGEPAVGYGFVSGHSAVAVALATISSHYFGPLGRSLVWSAAAIVCLGRMYVGAHLPLDVLGGAAMGWAVGALVHIALGSPHRDQKRRRETSGSA